MSDEYELLPHDELEYLRREVERLKRNPLGDTQASIGLLDSINSLNQNIIRLVSIFEGANDEMSRVLQDENMHGELRKLRQENAKIAHGIVALANIVKDVQEKQGKLEDIEQLVKNSGPSRPQTSPSELNSSFDFNDQDNPFEPTPPSPNQGGDITDDIPAPPPR